LLELYLIGWGALGVLWLITPGVWGTLFGLLFAIATFVACWTIAVVLVPLVAFFVIVPLIQYHTH